jgi:hypothetical protein
MNAIHNARVQLLATLLNTMAGSSFTVGVAAPIAASIFYGTTALPIGLIAVGVSIWLTIALMLHI